MAVAVVSSSAVSASGVVSTPGSIVTGNVIVFWGAHGGTLGAMPNADVILEEAGNAQFIAWITTADHIANGSPATYTFTSTTSVFATHAVQLSGTDLANPFDGDPDTNNTGTATTDAPTVLSPLTATARLLRWDFCTASRTVSVNPTGMTPLAGQAADAKAVHIWDQLLAASGSTGTKQATYTVGGSHWSSMAAIREPVTPDPGGGVVVGDVLTTITAFAPIVGGVKKTATLATVIVGGAKRPIP